MRGRRLARGRVVARANGVAWAAGLCALALVAPCGGCGGRREEVYTGRALIETEPEDGARVLVGGIDYGETPAVVSGLPPGTVMVHLIKDGYRRVWELVEIPEEGERTVVVELERLCGYLSITTDPPDARVYLNDDELLGLTPFTGLAVPTGDHTYRIELEDYEPVEADLGVERDYRYSFSYHLRPKSAELVVYSRPTGASIWLNNEPQREVTPASYDLRPGAYMVTIHTEGHVMYEEAVELGPNERHTIDAALVPGDVPFGMILIPASEFIFGQDGAAPDERPQRKVYLDAFYIDKYEVTNRQYQAVFPSHTFEPGREDFPVSGVSHRQASAFSAAVGKRLPTEQEWEKAARGEDGRAYPWGNVFERDKCNSRAAQRGGPQPAGSYLAGASPYGVLDMAGNVYEWTDSWYQPYPGNKDVTKDYGQIFKVLRGGSYLSGRFEVRCARRHYDRLDAARPDYGFRCAKDVAPGDM